MRRVVLAVRIPASLATRLGRLARREGMEGKGSRSDIVRVLLEHATSLAEIYGLDGLEEMSE